VRSLKGYIDQESWTNLNVDWSIDPNWLDKLICTVTAIEAEEFITCLYTASDKEYVYLYECFNKHLPNWEEYRTNHTPLTTTDVDPLPGRNDLSAIV
jgi:hypothetical protein